MIETKTLSVGNAIRGTGRYTGLLGTVKQVDGPIVHVKPSAAPRGLSDVRLFYVPAQFVERV
jgi:hypothetical protein